MKPQHFALAFALFAGAGCTQGSAVAGDGAAGTDERSVPTFSHVHADKGLRLVVRAGPFTGELSVQGDKNLLPFVTTTVSEGLLTVSASRAIEPRRPLLVEVSSNVLELIRATRGASILVDEFDRPALDVDVSSGASVVAAGRTGTVSVNASGGGRAKLATLDAQSAVVNASGGAQVEVSAVTKLMVKASGGAKVQYLGKPALEQELSGGATFTPLR